LLATKAKAKGEKRFKLVICKTIVSKNQRCNLER